MKARFDAIRAVVQMPEADRLKAQEDGICIACPECDQAGDVYRRHHTNTHIGDPDDPLACGKCGATFEEAVRRPPKRKGPKPKFADLDPEDLGLSTDGGFTPDAEARNAGGRAE